MAGRMGNENVTIQNLEIIDVTENMLMIKGLVPGVVNGLIYIKKIGEDKKFVPLWKPADAPPVAQALDDKEAMAGEEKVDEPEVQGSKGSEDSAETQKEDLASQGETLQGKEGSEEIEATTSEESLESADEATGKQSLEEPKETKADSAQGFVEPKATDAESSSEPKEVKEDAR